MIQLRPVPRPAELTDEAARQLTERFKADKSQSVWNKEFIKSALLEMSSGKCCYCECKIDEESKYLEVEHFHCKDIYEDEVVLWDNLLPSCKHCNGFKRTHDTVVNPIVHPVNDDPRDYLTFTSYRFYPKDDIGKRTIRVVNLNDRSRLVHKRYEVGSKAKEKLDELEEQIEEFIQGGQTLQKRNRILTKLRGIMLEGQPTEEYSATVATEILREDSYHFAKTELTNLGLWDDNLQYLENELIKISF